MSLEVFTNTFYKLFGYIWLINIVFVIIIVLLERRRTIYTLFWVFVLILTPYLGFIFYLFFGMSFAKQRKAKPFYNLKFLKSSNIIKLSERKDLLKWKSLINYLEMSSKNLLTSRNSIETFISTDAFFRSLKIELKKATKTINMEYYIFRNDIIGREICEILIKKAKEGLEINLIVDGANLTSKKMLKLLEKNGINAKVFFPSYFPFLKFGNLRANYRNHKKLCIIDTRVAFIGGANIGDEYLGKGKLGFWKDINVKIVGPSVIEIEKEFYFSMTIVCPELLENIKNKYKNYEELLDNSNPKYGKHSNYVQVVSSGPNYEFRTLRDNFLKLIQESKKYIYIQTPYFIPDDTVLNALKMAALSGIHIKIMIPIKPDHLFVYWVNRYYISELINLGVDIYEYDKGFLHNKLMIVDDEVVSLGTGNFDYRSFYLNFEININIYEEEKARYFREAFYKDMTDSKRINREKFKNRSKIDKFKESICKLLAPVL